MAQTKAPSATRPVGCIALALFAGLLWMACLVIASAIFEPREKLRAAIGWPEVPCVIQKLHIETHTIHSSEKNRSSTAFSPVVAFEYEIDGQTYVGDRFWLGGTLFNTHEEVAEIIKPYKDGVATGCYVNPTDPKDAVLSRELYDADRVGWMGLFMGLFGLVGGLGVAGALWFVFFPNGWRKAGGWAPASLGEVLVGWLAALAWNGLFGTLFVMTCLRGPAVSELVNLFVFPLVGVLTVVGASMKTWQYWQARKASRAA